MTSRAKVEPAFVVPTVIDRNRIAPKSLAVVFETQLKETFRQTEKSPSRERVNRCFGILEEINPFLGAFAELVKQIQDELQKSVYSNTLTSSSTGSHVEKIPYFTALSRIKELKREESSKINETIIEMQQKIRFRDHDINILQKKNLALKQEISEHLLAQQALKDKITQLENIIKDNERDKAKMNNYHNNIQQDLHKEIETLQTNLAQANHVIEKLTVFKTAYNQSDNEKLSEEERDAMKHNLVIDAQGMIDDYDQSLAQLKKKKEILSGVASKAAEREAAHQLELMELNVGFKKKMEDLLKERDLMKRHNEGLRLANHKYKTDKNFKTIRRTADDALRKYAVTVRYLILCIRQKRRCTNFLERRSLFLKIKAKVFSFVQTIVCPHRVLCTNPFKLPNGTTHIKFTQPSLRIKTIFNRGAYENLLNAKLLEQEEEEANMEDTEDEIPGVSSAFSRIWGDYYDNRNGTKALLHRAVPVEKIVQLIQEVYDSRWTFEDEYDDHRNGNEEGMPSFVDTFHNFMLDRYQILVVAQKATHDLFTELQQKEGEDEVLDMFIHHLCGEKDSMWKYFMLIRKLLNRFEVFDIHRYRQVIQTMYPSRSKENYDQIELEFIAYSKNRVTREWVERHLIHLIQASIEPNYRFFLKGLKHFDYQNRGFLTFEDFDEAISQMMPLANRRERKVRYKIAESATRKQDAVSLERLAQISCYLLLYASYQTRWESDKLISQEFLGTYFKDGFRDDVSDEASESEYEEENGLLLSEEKQESYHGRMMMTQQVDEAAIEAEAAKLQAALDSSLLTQAED